MTSVVHDRKTYPHSTQPRWRKRASRHSETRSRSNINGAYAYGKTHTWSNTIFGCKWFWWYLWPRIALKMPQEFPSASLVITLRSSASEAVSTWLCQYTTHAKSAFSTQINSSSSRFILTRSICSLWEWRRFRFGARTVTLSVIKGSGLRVQKRGCKVYG